MICKNFIASYNNGLKQPLHLNYIFQENVIETVCNLKCKKYQKGKQNNACFTDRSVYLFNDFKQYIT